MRAQVVGTAETLRRVLRWRDAAELLEPPELRAEMATVLEAVLRH